MKFTFSDVAEARRTLSGLLPATVRVECVLLNHGRTVSCVVMGLQGAKTVYDFGIVGRDDEHEGTRGPELTPRALMDIASEWVTGSYTPREAVAAPTPTAPVIATADALIEWVNKAAHGDTCRYFTGELALFRHEAPIRIQKFQKLADQVGPKKRRPATERFAISEMQKTLNLIEQVDKLHRSGVIALTQRRDGQDSPVAYLATRTRKHRSQTLNQHTQNKTIQRIRQAIQAAWAPAIEEGKFNFANIVFEGTTDDMHNTVARIDVWGANSRAPEHVRIAQVDLGDDPAAWGPILQHRLNAAKKLVRMRDRMNHGRVKFDE